MRGSMRRLTVLFFLLVAGLAWGESLRGPLSGELVVTASDAVEGSGIGLETIVLIDVGGDPRFLDAIDIELTSPAAAGDYAGALSLSILGPINTGEHSGIAEVVGEELLDRPILRGGKSFFQVVLREDARPDASPAVTRVGTIVPAQSFPIALSVLPRMKGLTSTLQNAEFTVAVRPVTRDIGAISLRYVREDGSLYDASSARAPAFELLIDDEPVDVANEYLLQPGLHRIMLRSDRFQDQDITVGVDRGRNVDVDLPLDLALATVNYTAPRGASVYVNGTALDDTTGDFTVPPGEHTIVVVLGDYTVTRRIRVEEQRTYSVSVTMDIEVEEIK